MHSVPHGRPSLMFPEQKKLTLTAICIGRRVCKHFTHCLSVCRVSILRVALTAENCDTQRQLRKSHFEGRAEGMKISRGNTSQADRDRPSPPPAAITSITMRTQLIQCLASVQIFRLPLLSKRDKAGFFCTVLPVRGL